MPDYKTEINMFIVPTEHNIVKKLVNEVQRDLNIRLDEDEILALNQAVSDWEYSKSLGLRDILIKDDIRIIDSFKKSVKEAEKVTAGTIFPRLPKTLPHIKYDLSFRIKDDKVLRLACKRLGFGKALPFGSKKRFQNKSYEELQKEDLEMLHYDGSNE